jgi:tRNA(Ile)-lysidine synthase
MARPPAVARVLRQVTATARAHDLFLPGETVTVAVSGGPDSMCLLLALHELRRLLRIRLTVFHFDHRLRRGSEEDAAYVRRASSRLRLPFALHVAETGPRPGESVEDWAHRARIEALALAMRDADATKGALGHTTDDQAETVLLALARGGGLDAVAGIRHVQGPFVRPLLDVTRADVEAFVRARRLRPRIDPTNRDTRFLRNALRHKGIPALERALGREVRGPLARSAALLRDDADELARLAAAAYNELVEDEPQGLAIPAAALAALPRAVGSRVVRSAAYRLGAAPSAEAVGAVLDLAAGRPARRRDLPQGLKARRDREYVHLSRPSPES